MRILIAVVCAALPLYSIAHAQPKASVKLVALPTAEDVQQTYPPGAIADRTPGRAVIRCNVAPDGLLGGCDVVSETPEGRGFGEAAVLLASKMRANASDELDREITLPVRFEPPPIYVEPIFKRSSRSFEHLGGPGPYYPAFAADRGMGGAATIACSLALDGRLKNCRLVNVEGDEDFGSAALRMAGAGWMTAAPRSVAGQPVADEVVFVRVGFAVRRR